MLFNEELLKRLQEITQEEKEIIEGNKKIKKELYSKGDNFIIDRDKMIAAGKLIDLRTHTRFIDFPEHLHDYVEMIYMFEGSTTHLVDEEEITVEKGEILLINQYCTHAIKAAGEQDIAVNIMVLPAFFHTAFNMMEGQNLLSDFIIDCLTQNDKRPQHLHFKVAAFLPVQNLMENLIWSILNPTRESDRLNSLTMGLLFQHLLDSVEDGAVENGSSLYSNIVSNVMKYIDSNYSDARLENFAKSEGYSLYEMSRIIKRETGVTFKQLLQIKRFSVAIKMLRSTDLAVSDIITAVGYDNTSYFHRQFRLKYGVSPAEYRKKYKV